MTHMKLISGGILLAKNLQGSWLDITPQAHMNLSKDVFLENVTVKDIYTLISNNVCLQQILFYNFVDDVIRYIKNKDLPKDTKNRDDIKIEFIEIFREASYDPELNTLEFDEQPSIHGLSYPLTKNYQSYKAGQRISKGLDFIHLDTILETPITLNSQVFCATGNYLSHYDFSNEKTFERQRYSFLDILNAITVELSFHHNIFEKPEKNELFDENDLSFNDSTDEEKESSSTIENTFTFHKSKEKTLLKGFSIIDSSINKNILNNIINYLPNKTDINLFFNHILPNKIFLKEEFTGLNAYEYRHKAFGEDSTLLPSLIIKKTINENKSLLNIHHHHVEPELFCLIQEIGGLPITTEELFSLSLY